MSSEYLEAIQAAEPFDSVATAVRSCGNVERDGSAERPTQVVNSARFRWMQIGRSSVDAQSGLQFLACRVANFVFDQRLTVVTLAQLG